MVLTATSDSERSAVPKTPSRKKIPSLALCMIVRNEEKHLKSCLLSAAPIADRIYITDTGSTDGTIAIARTFGAEIRHFPWQNDFSAARNHAISNISEDWILCLDADDYFPAGEAEKIPSLLAQSERSVFTLEYHVIEGHTPAPGLKLFKNHLGIRYEGIIHESIHRALERIPGGSPKPAGIKLHHRGYSAETAPAKLERNLPLLLREWERTVREGDHRQNLYVGKALANIWIQTGRAGEGERLLIQLLDCLRERAEPCHDDWEVAILISLICHYHSQNRDELAARLCADYESVFSRHPIFWLYRGICRFRTSHYPEALRDFQAFEESWGANPSFLSLPICYTTNDLWDWQGQCHMQMKRYTEAEQCFLKCLAHSPDNLEYQIKENLSRLLQHS